MGNSPVYRRNHTGGAGWELVMAGGQRWSIPALPANPALHPALHVTLLQVLHLQGVAAGGILSLMLTSGKPGDFRFIPDRSARVCGTSRCAHRRYTGGTPEAHRMHKGFSGVPPVCIRCASGVHRLGASPGPAGLPKVHGLIASNSVCHLLISCSSRAGCSGMDTSPIGTGSGVAAGPCAWACRLQRGSRLAVAVPSYACPGDSVK